MTSFSRMVIEPMDTRQDLLVCDGCRAAEATNTVRFTAIPSRSAAARDVCSEALSEGHPELQTRVTAALR
jgi:hypothetical protein